ncbi:MAG TPA: amino acid adenylation domain-containing protein [Pyrinomonadaceae bacterium]|jgi:amino acid adenylation domain-containing protein
MEELSSRIAQLSPAKRALLELRLKQGSPRAIPPRANHSSAEVSFAQQRLWFLDQIEENRALYNVPRAMRLSGALDIPALQRALNEIVSRHEPFRSYFASVDGVLQQFIDEKAELPLTHIDLSADEREDRANQIIREESLRPFDLARGPIIRASLLRLDEHEHILLLCTHHIVSDAWSAGILFRELEALYNAFSTGESPPLEPLPIQYADYAEWQRKWLQGEVLETQLSYWKKQLHDVTGILDLPTDRPRAAEQLSRGAYKVHTLSSDLSSRLAELSNREGATLFMTLLAAFQTLLWRYSNQDDIVVGSPIAGRNRVEIEDLIGFFINTLVLRANLSGNPTFRALLDQVKETAVGAYAHQDLPFEKLVEELQPQRDLNRNPLFQVMFQFQNTAPPQPNLNGLSTSRVKIPTETAKFDLLLLVREQDDALLCVMEYNSDLFDGETIERMLNNYATLLESVVTNPDAHIADLSLLTTAQRKQILIEWNATTAEFPYQKSIHQLFEEQAQLTPADVAVVCDTTRLTFAELNARANQLAQYLRQRGVGPEVRVAICVERSVEMIVGLLAILKAGGTYVPLEPTFPEERIAFIQADSQARALLTQKRLSLMSWTGETIYLDSDWPEIARESPEAPAELASAENSAHVIYTSGSTGRPKGVVSSHRASINRFAWMWRAYPFVESEVCCQKTSLSFVDSIWEIFGPLLQGVPLVIIPDDVLKDPQRFINALATNNVTRLVLVPSLLRVMLELGEDLAQQLGHLRICVCSGETLPVELATSFRQKLPQTLLINLYGSSEVAADVLCYEVDRTEGLAGIPLGRPIANTSVYVLDANFQPVPVDVPGEICVSGEGLARGYLDQPTLTAEKFVPDPFSPENGARLFRTGDIGRYLASGNIEYRGRRDHQVKVRGFRIELGEIEAQLATHAQVDQAIAVASDNERGEKQIVAYVVADGEVSPDELRDHLSCKLPGYMIPAAFVFLDAFPLTASGKINRLALPRPGPVARKEFVAPRTAVEQILAGIWSDVLNVAEIGVNDDFFGLGGHSLLLARIASRIRESFNVDLSLRVLFEASTVAELAKRVEAATQIVSEDVPLVHTERAPTLSFAQERLWFFDQLEPNSAAYNIPRMLRLRGSLDVAALQRSVNEIVLRHEVLRTSFISDNGKPALSIAENAAVEIQLIDLSSDERMQELASEEAQRPFNLSRGPLLRMTLLQLGPDEHVLLLTTHHIISDAWSVGIFMRELVACYNAFSSGDTPALLPLTLQYSDFASWQREWLSGARLQNQLDYWRQTLAGAPPVIDLPTDRPRPVSRSFRGARHSFVIGKETIDKLKTVARAGNATLFMTVLTTFQSLLSYLTNASDLVVGSPTAGRNQSDTEALIGYFANTIILRAQFSGDPAFRESLGRTRESAIAAFANQDLPFEKLVDELKPVRTTSYNPLFQVWFVLQNVQIEREEFRGLSMESIAIDNAATRHDLQLTLWESANGLEGAFTYSTDLFEAQTIQGIAEQFKTLVGLVAEQPDIKLSALRTAMNEKLSAATEEMSRQKLKSARRKVVTKT